LSGDFSGKPWNARAGEIPPEIFAPFGMVGPEERRCFYWLARHALTGQGFIVDAGCFLGASTLCFASGAAAAGHRRFQDRPIVHAYDYFKAFDDYVADAIRKNVRPIGKGDGYLYIFKDHTYKYADMIEAHPGNIFDQHWDGAPIELLFIDVAKRERLNAHLAREFFPSLVPGISIVIHQDYIHAWHPYIHVSMEYLSESFEVVDEMVPHQSRVWRLTAPIPGEKLARIQAYDFSRQEREALLDRLVANSSPRCRPMMEAVRLWQICLDGDTDRAWRELARLNAAYALDGRALHLWTRQMREIELRLNQMAGTDAAG
jgi:hypothetical protein